MSSRVRKEGREKKIEGGKERKEREERGRKERFS